MDAPKTPQEEGSAQGATNRDTKARPEALEALAQHGPPRLSTPYRVGKVTHSTGLVCAVIQPTGGRQSVIRPCRNGTLTCSREGTTVRRWAGSIGATDGTATT
ncbi:hypothetical protein GCM10010431_31380 [Streptomyces kunmingensis]